MPISVKTRSATILKCPIFAQNLNNVTLWAKEPKCRFYCESPPVRVGIPPHARLFLPALALVPLALEISRGRLGRSAAGRLPLPLVLIPFEVAWLVALGSQMR